MPSSMEPINYTMAHLSHYSYLAALVAYALATLVFAGDFAFGKAVLGDKPARKAASAPALVAVGAGAPAADPPPGEATASPGAPAGTLPSGSADSRPMGRWIKVALTLTVVGLAAHVVGVISRGLAVHRVPWGDMYEFVTTVTCAAVAFFVFIMIKYRAYRLGLFVLGPIVVFLGLAETVIYTPAGQLPPALQSYWLAIHVTSITLATGAFVVAAVFSLMYLFIERNDKRVAAGKPANAILRFLPSAQIVDRLAYRTAIFGFPLWTFGIIAGAIWADEAWGRYWGWDPTETWAFITWVVYAGYLHARATAGWRGRRAAFIQLVGFGSLLFNMTVVSLMIHGLHSYAGLS